MIKISNQHVSMEFRNDRDVLNQVLHGWMESNMKRGEENLINNRRKFNEVIELLLNSTKELGFEEKLPNIEKRRELLIEILKLDIDK